MSANARYLNTGTVDLGAECKTDATVSKAVLARQVDVLLTRLAELPEAAERRRAELLRQIADIQIKLEQNTQAWEHAFTAFECFARTENWQQAIEACDSLFRTEQPDSLIALGHAVWLSVTYPVDPALTVSQLIHIIDDTPEASDGAAVAAATAAYIADLRGNASQNDDLTRVVGQLLNRVAREHNGITTQTHFDSWFKQMELDQPEKFLVRLRNIIDVLVQDNWWIDRDALQAALPAD